MSDTRLLIPAEQTLAVRIGTLSARDHSTVMRAVDLWLRSLARQAERDGASAAPDVFSKTARKLREGQI